MTPQEVPRRQLLQDRLEFIEFRLLWDGQINRSDLSLHFGISPSQASTDLRQYQDLARGKVLYDVRLKAYVPGPDYQAVLLGDSVEAYLGQLAFLRVRAPSALSWIGIAPPFDVIQRGRRSISPHILRVLLGAIRGKHTVEVKYQSSSDKHPQWRRIAPHSLLSDTFRWHVRAWSYERNEFRDFVITRMLEIRAGEATRITSGLDEEWGKQVVLRLAPHPGLSEWETRAVELDYNMSSGEVLLPTRVCLVRYIEWQLRLDAPESPHPTHAMQVVLVNREQISTACSAARTVGALKGIEATQLEKHN